MARVRVDFNGGDVPVVIGDPPASENDPILNPTPTFGRTNKPFLFDAGLFTFALDTVIPCKPRWQTRQTADGIPLTMTFEVDTAEVVTATGLAAAAAAKPKRARAKKAKPARAKKPKQPKRAARAKKPKPKRAAAASKVKRTLKAKPSRTKKRNVRKPAR